MQKGCNKALILAAVLATMATSTASRCVASNDVAGSLILFNDNGAWSWFEDERAIVDTASGKLVVSSVANSAGKGGAARHGDVEVASYDLAGGAVNRFTLSNALEADDHNSAALWRRPDGRYLASYSKHNSDNFTRYRISTGPGDITNWGPEQILNNGTGTTYSNLHYLPADNSGAGRLYNLTRTVGFDPNILISNNLGDTLTYGGRLLEEGTSSDRPYARYVSDGTRIHVLTTERHPRDFDNSIFHGYIQDGKLFNSQGTVVDANVLDASAVAPANLTKVFATGTQFGGVAMRRAWTVDMAIDDAGQPVAVFQARANDADTDHRYFYARFDGATWNVNPLAKAGGFLYAAENDYTGLVALEPSNPNRLFLSTKIDPRNDAPLAHYEIFAGTTTNAGANWSWVPVTFNSTVDNLRPIVPQWDSQHTALLWLRGAYASYTSYNLNIVGLTNIGTLVETPTGDLNSDGKLDTADFAVLLNGLHTNLTGLSWDEAFRHGDLNGDFASDFDDFVIFRNAYDLANGAGSFAVLTQSVPEPSSNTIIAAGFGGLIFQITHGRARFYSISPSIGNN